MSSAYAVQAVAVFGHQWFRVAKLVPGRDQVQVRERYKNHFEKGLKKKEKWTHEEDAILVQALNECKNTDGSFR